MAGKWTYQGDAYRAADGLLARLEAADRRRWLRLAGILLTVVVYCVLRLI